MPVPYLGEIRMFAGDFAPPGWALCQGQLLNISENEQLYNLIGTTYGGDGQTTFALPDLQGRVVMHSSTTFPFATKGGAETVALSISEMPAHTHVPQASTDMYNRLSSPQDAFWTTLPGSYYSDGVGVTPVLMNSQAISSTGGDQSHDNMMPTLTLSFIIALEGIVPQEDQISQQTNL